jgi:hypothetical protein
MSEIPLTHGMVALVDEADFEEVSRYKWHAFRSGPRWYARRNRLASEDRPDGLELMHRRIARTPPGMDTDHINGNGLDNRRANLRHATRAQNAKNRAPNRSGSSIHKGVFWHGQSKRWRASIQVDKRRIHLGNFVDEAAAAKAYERAAELHFGQFNRRLDNG